MSANGELHINIPSVKEIEYLYESQNLPRDLNQLSLRLGFSFERNENDLTICAKVLCLNPTDVFISYATAWTFRFPNIEEQFSFSTDRIQDKKGIMSALINTVVGGLRGQLSLKTADIPCGQINLPLFTMDDILKTIRE